MAERPIYVSDGIFYGAFSWLLAGVFGIGIGFAYTGLHGGSLVGGFMIAGIVAVIGGWIISRFAAGGSLPPPNTVRIDVPPAPTVPRSRAAEARAEAAAPKLPDQPPSAHDVGVAVGATARSAMESVKDAANSARATVADAVAPSGSASARSEEKREAETAGTPPAEAVEPRKPATLKAPREDGPDDLTRLRGVGPKLATALNEAGTYHFDQIAGWTTAEIAWIDQNIEGASGRASREDWVGQARGLMDEKKAGDGPGGAD